MYSVEPVAIPFLLHYCVCVLIMTVNRIHKFEWHGTDPNNKTRKIPGQLKFTKLRVIPDQFYLNIDDVRHYEHTPFFSLLFLSLLDRYVLKTMPSSLWSWWYSLSWQRLRRCSTRQLTLLQTSSSELYSCMCVLVYCKTFLYFATVPCKLMWLHSLLSLGKRIVHMSPVPALLVTINVPHPCPIPYTAMKSLWRTLASLTQLNTTPNSCLWARGLATRFPKWFSVVTTPVISCRGSMTRYTNNAVCWPHPHRPPAP